MSRGKQYVFSGRTTENGLAILNAKKAELGVDWDELLIGAVNAHYGITVPMPRKAESRPKAGEPKAEERKVGESKAKPKAEKAGKKAKRSKPTPEAIPEPAAQGQGLVAQVMIGNATGAGGQAETGERSPARRWGHHGKGA